MVSTPEERVAKATGLINTLIGTRWNKHIYSDKRPDTLPKGINFTRKEWCLIQDSMCEIRQKKNISIDYIFALDTMAEKYKEHLFLAKLTI